MICCAIKAAGLRTTFLPLACTLINEGKVPTRELLGASFPLDRFEDALALADRRLPGQDAVRVSLEISS